MKNQSNKNIYVAPKTNSKRKEEKEEEEEEEEKNSNRNQSARNKCEEKKQRKPFHSRKPEIAQKHLD